MNLELLNKHRASTDWLIANYGHVVYNQDMSIGERAGFLAAVCHPHRCALSMLAVHERVNVIFNALLFAQKEGK